MPTVGLETAEQGKQLRLKLTSLASSRSVKLALFQLFATEPALVLALVAPKGRAVYSGMPQYQRFCLVAARAEF